MEVNERYEFRSVSIERDFRSVWVRKKGSNPIDREELKRELKEIFTRFDEVEYQGNLNAFLYIISEEYVYFKPEENFIDYLNDDDNFRHKFSTYNSVRLMATENDERFIDMPWNKTQVWTGCMYMNFGVAKDNEDTRLYIEQKKERTPSLIPDSVEEILPRAIKAYQEQLKEMKKNK